MISSKNVYHIIKWILIDQLYPRSHIIIRRKKLYYAFMDLEKAFDSPEEAGYMAAPTIGGSVIVVTNCCANCVEPFRFLEKAGHADPLDGWRCSS